MNLNIYDVSAIVHTAVSGSKDETYYGYPISGIKALWRRVSVDLISGEGVLLCFDSPTDKYELVPTYKAGRAFNPIVASQIDSIYNDFEQAGFRCLKVENYEADDLIHWAAMANRKKYTNVNIYGNDYDLCHSVVGNVVFRSISPMVHMVNQSIFENAVERGSKVLFNTISAKKSLCGCASDKVPAIKLANGLGGEALYNKFLEYYRENFNCFTYENSSSITTFCKFLLESNLFSEEEVAEAYKNALVVYPKPLEQEINLTPSCLRDLDKEWLRSILAKYGLKDAAQVLRLKLFTPTEEQKAELIEKSNKLKNGIYSIDKNMQPTASLTEEVLQELEVFGDDDY